MEENKAFSLLLLLLSASSLRLLILHTNRGLFERRSLACICFVVCFSLGGPIGRVIIIIILLIIIIIFVFQISGCQTTP